VAKIVQTLTRASEEYQADTAQSLVRDLDAVSRKIKYNVSRGIKTGDRS
jgi:hypothetical protein